jgi:hypothetical protein
MMNPNSRNYPKGYIWIMQQVGHQGDDCLIWPLSCCTPGYGIFTYEKKDYLAHRFMCEKTHGPAPEGYHAAHSCGNRRCVNPGHLSWKTATDNQLDRRKHGTAMTKQSKLTKLQAMQIRQLKGLEKTPETAAKYGITESNVRHIQEGKTWRDDRKISPVLTREQVLAIRKIGWSKSLREISTMFGVGTSAVDRVRSGRCFKGVV